MAIASLRIFSILIISWGYAFWPTIKTMYNYQSLIIISLVLAAVISQKAILRRANCSYNSLGLLLVLLCSVLWLFAVITDLVTLANFALISMLPCFVLATYGAKIMSIIAFPLLCLWLLIPLEQTVFLIIGAVYSFLITKSLVRRIFITSNFLTIPMMFMIFNFGFLTVLQINIAGAILAVMLGWKFRNINTTQNYGDNIDWRSNYIYYKSKINLPQVLTIAVVLLLPFTANYLAIKSSSANDYLLAMPNNINDWAGPIAEEYSNNNQHVALYIDNINKSYNKDYIYDPSIWKVINNHRLKIKLSNKKIHVTETIVKYKSYSKIIWTVNSVNGHLTTSPLLARVLKNLHDLSSRGSESGLITLATDSEADINLARSRLKNFILNLEKTHTIF